MKAICKKSYTFVLPFVFGLIFSLSSLAQPYPFVLSPTGTTTNFMKFVPKQFTPRWRGFVIRAGKTINTELLVFIKGITAQKFKRFIGYISN